MKFFANKVNSNFLQNVLPDSRQDIDWVKAAIAYGSDSSTLLEHCLANGHRLDIWMRYDHTVPVSPQLLRALLNATSRNVFCKLVPDVHHAKIIWWGGYGVYIGSANLTNRAWWNNIEAGIFLSEEELAADGAIDDIDNFFHYLEELDEAFPLSEEIIQEQDELEKLRRRAIDDIDERAKAKRGKPIWEGPTRVAGKKELKDRKMSAFIREWEDGLTILRSLAETIELYKPAWLPDAVPKAWQADQFLHAYYYNQVTGDGGHPFDKFYLRNRSNPAVATNAAMEWWATLDSAPSEEDVNLTERAPTIRDALSKQSLSSLTLKQFTDVVACNHSSRDHSSKVKAELFGRAAGETLASAERVPLFAEWLWKSRNRRGEGVTEVLDYVLYGGSWKDTPKRLFAAAFDEDRKLARFGVNQLAELVGWARPEHFPPRNGRTSKALRALGYDVRVY